jgi:hypothetical protein
MKKLIAPVIALSLFSFVSCRSNDDDTDLGQPKDPIDNVKTEPIQYGAIINSGNVTQKSLRAEMTHRFLKLEGIKNNFVIHIPVEGGALHDTARNKLDYFITPLMDPNEYYLNSDVFNFEEYEDMDIEMFNLTEQPTAAVNHIHSVQGDSIIINARVEFFKNVIGKTYFVASYLVADFQAKSFEPGVDFRIPNVPGLVNTNIANENIFINDFPNDSVTIFKNQEKYHHTYVVIGEPKFPLGIQLDSVNIFGKEYEKGDVYGTKEMPLRMAIPKNHRFIEFASGLGIWTVLYEMEEDVDPNGDPVFFFVIKNSFLSKI